MSDLSSMTMAELKALGDDLWQRVVGHMAMYRCEMCGALAYGGHHHMVGRSLMFRFKVKYGFPSCFDCHRKIHDKGDGWFLDWLKEHDVERAQLFIEHFRHRKEISREEVEEDVRALITYSRENGLYSPD